MVTKLEIFFSHAEVKQEFLAVIFPELKPLKVCSGLTEEFKLHLLEFTCTEHEVSGGAFRRTRRGLLIYSPPGVGKTTALRALALALGQQKPPLRVVVIDERLEFFPEEYRDGGVDILRGYRRDAALRIAYRSMNPEVILMDEIGGPEEAEGLSALLRGGAVTVATAHAKTREDLFMRGALRPFFERRIFDVFLSLKRENGVVVYDIEEETKEKDGMCECSVILA